jgi:hypothetical protein
MTDTPVSGAQSYVEYRKETTYGVDAAGTNYAFGHEINIDINRKNNMIEVLGLNDVNVKALLEGKYEGMVTINGVLANARWLGMFWGASATTGSAPHTHTFTESNTPPSVTIENGINLGTTDSVCKLLGCVLDSLNLKCAVGEPIRFTAKFFYKNEAEGTSLDGSPANETETPFTFANATVAMPAGTTLTNVQNLDINLNRNVSRVYGLNSRFLTNVIFGKRGYEVILDKTFEIATILEQFYGSTTAPNATVAESTMNINITNADTGSAERHIEIQLAGVKPNEFSNPQKPNELIVENVALIARYGTGIAQDDTSSTPFD